MLGEVALDMGEVAAMGLEHFTVLGLDRTVTVKEHYRATKENTMLEEVVSKVLGLDRTVPVKGDYRATKDHTMLEEVNTTEPTAMGIKESISMEVVALLDINLTVIQHKELTPKGMAVVFHPMTSIKGVVTVMDSTRAMVALKVTKLMDIK